MAYDYATDALAILTVFLYLNAPIYFTLIWKFRKSFMGMGMLLSLCLLALQSLAVAGFVIFTRDFWLSGRFDPGLPLSLAGWLIFLFSSLLMLVSHSELGGVAARLGLSFIKGTGEAKLVTSGIYSKARHPMLSSAFLMGIGLSLAGGYPVLLLSDLAWLVLMRFYTDIEEKVLEEEFGERYLEYKRKTPRFFPRLH